MVIGTMKKILLIEDDLDLYALLKYNLEREGFQLVGSNTGKGAVDLCVRESRTFGHRSGAAGELVGEKTGI